MELTLKQTQAIDYLEDDETTELLFGGAAGGGKSAFGVYWILKNAFKYPGTRWLIGRAHLKTLKETTLVSLFEVGKKQELVAGRHYQYNGQSNQIACAGGSVVLLKDLFTYPSDPNFDELGSLELTGAFIDEANQVSEKARNIVRSRIRFRLDDYRLLPRTLYTCNPAKNWVYTDFYRPHRDGTLPKHRKFIQSLVDDNPFISKHYRDNLLALDKASKERLLYGNWEYDDDPAALIDYDKIIDCFSNSFVPEGESYITADIARFGSDKTIIGVWSGFRVKIFTYQNKSVEEVANIIKDFQRRFKVPNSRTVADEDGVGGGVVDIVKCQGFVNNSSALNDENFNNLKSQCYFKLADRIMNSGLFIDNVATEVREIIIQELEQVKQHDMDKDGKRKVLPKDKVKEIIGRSPDYSDMLMMREYFELKPKVTWLIK